MHPTNEFITVKQSEDLLRILPIWFNPGELIWSAYSYRCNGLNNGYAQPVDAVIAGLMTKHPINFFHGAKIGLNPANPNSTYRLQGNCGQIRNILIEIDDTNLSRDQQLEQVRASGLPFSTAVWSGGKSVHFVIALEHAVDLAKYQELHARILVALRGTIEIDAATYKPTLYTRAPIGLRTKVIVPPNVVEDLKKYFGLKIQDLMERGRLDWNHVLSPKEWMNPINEQKTISQEQADSIVVVLHEYLDGSSFQGKQPAEIFAKVDSQELLYCGSRIPNQDLMDWVFGNDNLLKWIRSPEYKERAKKNRPKFVPNGEADKQWLYKLVTKYASDELGLELDFGQHHIACPSCRLDGHDSGGGHLAVLIKEDLTTLISCHKGCSFVEVKDGLKEFTSEAVIQA